MSLEEIKTIGGVSEDQNIRDFNNRVVFKYRKMTEAEETSEDAKLSYETEKMEKYSRL